MVSFIEVFKTIAENKIISRVTASGAIFAGLFMLNTYFVNPLVNPEVLAVAASIMTGASVFLFMSEKD